MNRHPFRAEALVFGLAFLGIAGLWVNGRWHVLSPDRFAYALAAILVVLGVVGIVASISKPRNRKERTDVDQTTDPQP